MLFIGFDARFTDGRIYCKSEPEKTSLPAETWARVLFIGTIFSLSKVGVFSCLLPLAQMLFITSQPCVFWVECLPESCPELFKSWPIVGLPYALVVEVMSATQPL